MIFSSFVAKAIAADTYQIIPLDTQQAGSLVNVYEAFVLNTATGDIRYCYVDVDPKPTPNTIDPAACLKDQVVTGTMPPGPADLANYNMQRKVAYAGLWKVDQSTGSVTFCARQDQGLTSASKWVCRNNM
jgi:hypothetical protein